MTDKHLPILIVEDSESDTGLILRQFQRAYYTVSHERVETADQMRSALGRQPWNLIIADYSLPQFNATSALAVLQKSGLDIPFIVVSGTIGEETAIALMKAGAHDCIMKDHLPRLVPAVERELSEAETRRAKRVADDMIRKAAEEWTRTFNSITDLVSVQDTEYRLIKVNQPYARAVNMTPDELIGKRCYEVLHETVCSHAKCPHEQMLLTKKTAVDEIFDPRFGKFFEVTMSPIFDVNGTLTGSVHIAKDITSRKRSEEALRTSQRQLSETMDLAKIVYWETGPTNNMFIFNDAFYAFYGTSAEQEGGYRMTREEFSKRFVHPDDLQLVRRFMEQNTTIKGAELSSDLEHRIIRRDGEVRHILVRASVVKDDSGRIVRRYGANQDITDRKEMANALQESGEQFEKLFMESPLGMVIVDADGRFTRANMAFCRMLGYTEQELTSLRFKDITHPDHIGQDVSQVNDLTGGKAALYQTEKQYIRKDKGILWASITVNVMRDRDDRFLHFFTTVEDITIRKQTEEALNQSLKKLRRSLMGTIQAMVSLVEIRDPYTAGHEKRVSMLARAIAHELGLPNDVVDNIRMAASIHDIGKISVPAEILSKPGRLTDIEMKLIQMHSQTGYDILKDVDLPYPIARIVLQHHERLNGSGYPQSVKAGEILLEARIVSVADVVEAMASYRPYRPALGIDTALEEIEKNKGIFYDAVVVNACVRLFREKGFKLE